jgi:hypothetical protein
MEGRMSNGQDSPAATIASLGRAGVDFSVPVADLTDWLSNPEFTPYPALAHSLLKLLTGRRLQRPVFIDVIAFDYENTPGVASPRKDQDVRTDVLEAAVVTGYNERYGASMDHFQNIVVPLDIPPVITPVAGLTVEGTTKVTADGVILVDTDNPELITTFTLTTVHADWANAMVPQEITRQQLGWQFSNGDAVYSIGDGEADAKPVPTRAGSLNDEAYAWPTTEGTFSGSTAQNCTVSGRIRVGYKPVSGRLLIRGPRSFAPNTGPTFRIALDPDVLLVPVEVVRFFSPNVPIAQISAARQMALWDQVPIIDDAGNTHVTDGGTGELTNTLRQWDLYPKTTPDPAQPRGLYEVDSWVSPDSIWGRAKVRFRLVNYFEIQTDDGHVNPRFQAGGVDDSVLRENHNTLTQDPRHIKDKRVVTVIYMFRIGPPDAQEIGRALIGLGAVGIAAGVSDKFADIAHEIGHLIQGSGGHSTLDNNVMNNPGPGTDITPDQIAAARSWAQGFSDFWQKP